MHKQVIKYCSYILAGSSVRMHKRKSFKFLTAEKQKLTKKKSLNIKASYSGGKCIRGNAIP